MTTPGNSSANIGTPASDLGRKDEFTCRCCLGIFGGYRCWEWRDGSWLCTDCANLLVHMLPAGETRCTLALAFLSTPREIRTGWDN